MLNITNLTFVVFKTNKTIIQVIIQVLLDSEANDETVHGKIDKGKTAMRKMRVA